MSARLVGLVLEHYPGSGNELLLAIVVADESDHNGGNIRATIPLLARLSRQTEQSVRRLFRKMEESTWLQCLERSTGGRGRPSEYCINPEGVKLPTGWQPKPEQPELNVRVSDPKPEHNPNLMCGFMGDKPELNVRVSDPTLLSFKSLPPIVPHFELTTDSGNAGENALDADQRLARWMLDRLRTLNPNHREPKNWTRWIREIRLLRTEVKGLTHREIAAVFKWANEQRTPKPGGDFCWANVILSPGNLRAHWDRLRIEHAPHGFKAHGRAANEDGLCQTCHQQPATMQMGRGPKQCRACFAIAEQVTA